MTGNRCDAGEAILFTRGQGVGTTCEDAKKNAQGGAGAQVERGAFHNISEGDSLMRELCD